MFVITLNGKENQGVYSVTDDYGEQIVYLFEEEDDAVRYAMMLEEEDYPEMHVIEIEDKIILKLCKTNEYAYTIITKNDIVVPPNTYYDNLQEN